MLALMGAGANAADPIILKAPDSVDDLRCYIRVSVAGRPPELNIPCDVVVYDNDGRRHQRMQFNNDDSGRMVIFEGRVDRKLPGQFRVIAITFGSTKPGDTSIDHMSKATAGFCMKLVGRTLRCHAETAGPGGVDIQAGIVDPKEVDPDWAKMFGIRK